MDWVEPANFEDDADVYRSARGLADDLRKRIAELGSTRSDRLISNTWRLGPDVLVIAVAGAMDLSNMGEVTSILAGAARAQPMSLIIDFSQLTFIDSTAITALVRVAREIEGRGGVLVLASPPPHVARVLEVLSRSNAVVIAASLEGALRSAGGGSSWPAVTVVGQRRAEVSMSTGATQVRRGAKRALSGLPTSD